MCERAIQSVERRRGTRKKGWRQVKWERQRAGCWCHSAMAATHHHVRARPQREWFRSSAVPSPWIVVQLTGARSHYESQTAPADRAQRAAGVSFSPGARGQRQPLPASRCCARLPRGWRPSTGSKARANQHRLSSPSQLTVASRSRARDGERQAVAGMLAAACVRAHSQCAMSVVACSEQSLRGGVSRARTAVWVGVDAMSVDRGAGCRASVSHTGALRRPCGSRATPGHAVEARRANH